MALLPSHLRTSSLLSGALLLGLATFSLSACSESEDPGTNGSTMPGMTGDHGAHGTQGGHDGHGGANESDCKGAPIFAPNTITVTGTGGRKLTVIGAEPTAPIVNHNNAWIIKLTNMDGTPVDGATFPKFSPQMPHHNHGLPAEHLVQITPSPANGAGAYRVSNLAFSMAGYWKTDITAQGSVNNVAWTDQFVIETCIGK